MSKVSGGLKIAWSAEHKDGNGNLIVRMAVLEPKTIECFKLSCLLMYPLSALQYMLACYYHKCRAEYAERKRHRAIPMKYRTGEPSPETIWGAIKEILILKVSR